MTSSRLRVGSVFVLFVLVSVTRGLFAAGRRGGQSRTVLGKESLAWRRAISVPRFGRHATLLATTQLPAVALNTNSNVPLRSLSRVHKPCRQLFYSPPSILPPPPPLSTSTPNYSPWMPVIAQTMTATIFTLLSTFPIPTPPLLPPIQTTHFLPPTIPQTFSTLSNQSISTHLMFRVQFLPSSPQNNIPRLNFQLNCPPLTPTSLITPYNWTRLRLPVPPILARRVHTSL
jgi:hypothetical protein